MEPSRVMDRLEQLRREFCDEHGDDLAPAAGCLLAVFTMLLVAALAVMVLWWLL